MKPELSIVPRVLTAEFYRANTAFFLMILGIAAGFMRAPEHLALAGFFVSSPVAMLIPIGVWLMYTFKIVLFNTRELDLPRNQFVHTLPLLGFSRKWRVYISVALGEMAPAIGYGVFIASVGVQLGQLPVAMIAVVSPFILTSLIAFLLARTLERPAPDNGLNALSLWLDRRFAKPLVWVFTQGVLRLQPGLFYATKIFTILLILGTSRLYLFDDYDGRLYAMGGCFAFAANLTLVFQYQRFELAMFPLLRSLPIRPMTRILTFAATMTLLCFPEIAMLATYLPTALSWQEYLMIVVFGIALVVLGGGALYQRPMSFDTYTRWVFFATMGCFLAILFTLPVWILTIVCGAIGTYWLMTRYYGFEPVPDEP